MDRAVPGPCVENLRCTGPEAEAMLFAAARDDHIHCTILPALDAGQWVISDRFADSTRVYQGVLGEVDQRLIKALERVSVGDVRPDLTLVLDVPAQIGLQRAAGRRRGSSPDRFEAEAIEFHERLREAYRKLAASEPQRCVIIDASAPKMTVAKHVWQGVNARLRPATAPVRLASASS